MRKVLEPVARLAEEENIALIIVRHTKKGYGSVGITAVARSELLVGKVCGRRTLVQLASNNGSEGKALGFEIGDDCLTFTGLCSMRVEDILNPPKNSDRYIEAFLRATLPCRVTDVRYAAKKASIKPGALARLVGKLGILRERMPLQGGRGKCCYLWRFPDGPGGRNRNDGGDVCRAHSKTTDDLDGGWANGGDLLLSDNSKQEDGALRYWFEAEEPILHASHSPHTIHGLAPACAVS